MRTTLQPAHSNRRFAFTRAELLIVLAVLSLLALVVLPALANNRPRSHRVICANNLRQIGMAMQLWGNDHGDRPAYEVELSEGGTRRHSLAANTWFHFAWMSNELNSPKILLCPSDTGTPATEFSGDPTKGYFNPNFANRATSYFLGYTYNLSPSSDPKSVVVGDRNFKAGGIDICSVFNIGYTVFIWLPNAIQWTTGLHSEGGNALTWDGAVAQVNSEGLGRLFYKSNVDGTPTKHLNTPR